MSYFRKRRTEEQNRYLLQRALEIYRKRIRQRASSVIAEFLGTRRPPIRPTVPQVRELVKAVFEGRRRVPWFYELVLRHRGRWLAIKWGWYIREKTYWREKFEDLARMLELYDKYYQMLRKGYIEYVLAEISAWADSYDIVEPELCTARLAKGPAGEAVRFFRRVTLYEGFRRFAFWLARLWPNRRYKVIIVIRQRNKQLEKIADKGGLYVRDFGFGSRRYWIYSFRVYGKDLQELLRPYLDIIEVLQVWTIDPPPIAPECESA